jgi:hypothetical protein
MARNRSVRLLAPFAVLALGGGLVACGGDDDGKDTSAQAKAFCQVAAPVKALSGILESSDTAKIKGAFESAATALAQVSGDPPKDIAGDIATIKTTFTAADDALKAAGYDTAKVDRSKAAAIGALEDAAFSKAGDNVQAWTTKNC